MSIETEQAWRAAFERLERARAAFDELPEPTSMQVRLALRDERRRREAELTEALAEIGALAYDAAQGDVTRIASLLSEDDVALAPDDAPDTGDARTPQDEVAPASAMDTESSSPASMVAQTSVLATTDPAEAEPRHADHRWFETTQAEPAEEEEATRVPVTAEMLAALQSEMQRKQSWRASPATAPAPVTKDRSRTLTRALKAMGPTPEDLSNKRARQREVDALVRTLTLERLDTWEAAGEEANFALTAWFTARARAVQPTVDDDPVLADQVRRLFPRISRHSQLTRPGMIQGLARVHEAPGGSWTQEAVRREASVRELLGLADFNEDDALRRLTLAVSEGLDAEAFCERARALLDAGVQATETRLVNLALGYGDAVRGPGLKQLRKAVQQTRNAAAAASERDTVSALPDDWPCRTLTLGKRAVIVGGDPRPQRRDRLQEAFGFEALEWLADPKNGVRQIEPLTRRMQNGSVDVVIVLRAFSSHKVSDRIFDTDAPSCLRVLADSYGVTQVRLALERVCPHATS